MECSHPDARHASLVLVPSVARPLCVIRGRKHVARNENKYGGNEIKVDGEDFLLLRADDIYAIVTE